ncbi:MAG TPA: hypothetical protein VM531_00215 [Sphingomicrobium sp.]|jgi:hypothetical protein|nr:hypothetical protein [Sphingomicrobium sp.]
MANRVFGEARLPLSDGRELTLRFDFNALCEAEEAAGKGTREMMAEMSGKNGSPRLKTARGMLYGALRHHHEDITVDDAGELLLTDGEAISEAMGEAMANMAAQRAGGENPPQGTKAAKPTSPGTGTRSSKSGRKRT